MKLDFFQRVLKRPEAGRTPMHRRSMFSAFFSISAFLYCLVPSVVANAQTPRISFPAATTTKSHQFDVVSIRPSQDAEWIIGMTETGYRAIGLPLWMTIRKAYFPAAFQDKNLIKNAPSWVWNDKFNVVGKVNENDMQSWNAERHGGFLRSGTLLQQMLQAALIDRCGLKVHRVPGETPGYALVLKKNVHDPKKLKPSSLSDPVPTRALPIPLGGNMAPEHNSQLDFFQTPMAALASQLSLFTTQPVEDKTGLSGKYDFSISRSKYLSTEISDSSRTSGANRVPYSSWNLDALGLELKPVLIHTEYLVIDHIDRPSDN